MDYFFKLVYENMNDEEGVKLLRPAICDVIFMKMKPKKKTDE